MRILQIGAGALCLLLLSSGSHAEESVWDWMFSFKRMKEVEAVSDATYEKECGACHFAYQPGWLPAASWNKLIDPKALADHFGDNAELDEADRLHISEFLTSHAADDSWYKRSRKIMASLNEGDTPLRISETPYLKEKHHEIPMKLIKENSQVKSLSACQKCHQKADEGRFDDDTVLIPGHGHW